MMNIALPRTMLSNALAGELFRLSPVFHHVFELNRIMTNLATGQVEDIWQHDTPDGFILEVKISGTWHRISFTNIGEDWSG
jgi:hypothetical protein